MGGGGVRLLKIMYTTLTSKAIEYIFKGVLQSS